jgi:hypothetical protein
MRCCTLVTIIICCSIWHGNVDLEFSAILVQKSSIRFTKKSLDIHLFLSGFYALVLCIPRYRDSWLYLWLFHRVILNENLFKRGTLSAELEFCMTQSRTNFCILFLTFVVNKN